MKNLMYMLTAILLFSIMNPGNGIAQSKKEFSRRHLKENFIEKLNLSDEQLDKISSLRTAHQKEMIDLRADLRKKMIDMRELSRNPNLTRTELIAAVEDINIIKNRMAIAKANHRMDIFELLNAEQKKTWQELKPFRDNIGMKFNDGNFGSRRFHRGKFRTPFDSDNEIIPEE